MSTLRLVSMGVFALLAGCPGPVGSKPDSGDSPSGSTDDSPTSETTRETGLVSFYLVGMVETADGSFVSGEFGFGYFSDPLDDWACTNIGEMTLEGDADLCPGCEWAFDLSAVSGATQTGPACGALEASGANMGIDGYLDYDWGFAPTYDYDYGGQLYVFEDVVLISVDGTWAVVSFNYDTRRFVTVVGETVSFATPSYGPGGVHTYYSYYK